MILDEIQHRLRRAAFDSFISHHIEYPPLIHNIYSRCYPSGDLRVASPVIGWDRAEAVRNKYYFDELYAFLFRDGFRNIGTVLWRVGDMKLIDGVMVNGSAHVVGWIARLSRKLQSGYLYTYAFSMLIGVLGLLVLWIARTRAVF